MTATYDAYPTPDARPSHTQDPTSVSTQHVEKPLPAGWKLVDAKEAEVNQGETPWVDPALAAIAENSAGEVSGALAHDKWHGMDNESPIEPVYEEIIDKRIRAAKIAGGIAAIAIGAGITLGIGAIKYEVGTTTGTAHDPIIPGNSIAIGDHGLPGLAYKDAQTGTIEVDETISIVSGTSGILGVQLIAGGVGMASLPAGVRRTARKMLAKQKKDLR